MKTKITLALISLFLFMNGKQTKASSLTIDLHENYSTTYFITINNATTYQSFDDLIIKDLPHGQHKIVIMKQIESRRGRRGRVMRHKVLAFDGFIDIPPRARVRAKLRHRNLMITEVIQRPVRRRRARGCNMHDDYHRRPHIARDDCRNDCRHIHRNDCQDDYIEEVAPVLTPMPQAQFDNLFYTVQDESFDSGKLSILQPVLASNYFSANQILDLMSLFSFDSGKLKVAKMGYGNTLDKGNYFVVNQGLTFSSSKRKLSEFIQNQRI